MRFTALTSLAVLALVCQGQPCSAQAAPPDKTGVPQTLTGPGGSDEGAKLSTSEKQHEAPTAQASAPSQAFVPSKDVKGSESAHDLAPTAKATAKEVVGRVGTLSPDEERRAARARERATAAAKVVPIRAAASEHDEASGSLPSARPKAPGPRRVAPVAAARVAPVAIAGGPAKIAGGPANKHARTTEARSSGRGTPAPEIERKRTASGADARHHAPRLADAPSVRRDLAADSAWVPKVGDVVPPGVRLLPLPPGYRPGQGYEEGAMDVPRGRWRYVPRRAYLSDFGPRPRYVYDDEFPRRARVFVVP